MICIEDSGQLRRWSRAAVEGGESIALVPTMGSLHEGHLSLVRLARSHADRVVVSIFVNPLQFGAGEDLGSYPRDDVADLAACEREGVDAVFLPGDIYPPGFATRVEVDGAANGLCGASRAGHFGGVATVVLKLFHLVRPTVAVFGEKDYQQLQVVRQMVRDLDLDIDVVGGPIVRDSDGMALSSRNAHLSPDERAQATVLSRGLALAEQFVEEGQRDPASLVDAVRALIDAEALSDIDYVELVAASDLSPLDGPLREPALLALAVRFGPTRLIDNRVLVPETGSSTS